MDAEHIKGLSVVSIAEAGRIGRVDDILFRAEPLQAAALVVGTAHGDRLLPMARVRNIGEDAITTDTEAEATAGEVDLRREDLRGLQELSALKVVDLDGGFLGNVTRVEVDPATGAVRSLDVRRGAMLGVGGDTTTIDRDRVVAVGPELITVNAALPTSG